MSFILLTYLKIQVYRPNTVRKSILLPILPLIWSFIQYSHPAIASDIPQLPQVISQSNLISGRKISVNNYISSGMWFQKPTNTGQVETFVNDRVVKKLFGIDLLNNTSLDRQPIYWFNAGKQQLVINTLFVSPYRYLNITQLAEKFGWEIQVKDSTLIISTPPTQVTDILTEKHDKISRLVVNLNRPTSWRVIRGLPIEVTIPKLSPGAVTPLNQPIPVKLIKWTINVDGTANPTLIQRYSSPPIDKPISLSTSSPPINIPKNEVSVSGLETTQDRTGIDISVPDGLFPQVTTASDPDRLIIDFRDDPLVPRDIIWTQGLRWRQHYINLAKDRFPVFWLELNPQIAKLQLKPIWGNPQDHGQNISGINSLIDLAQSYSAIGAINGGYFNRDRQLPLGAIRQQDRWISGPILNRGAIAWNDSRQFYFDRLTLTESLTVNHQSFPILFLNSGYLQNGISRYTSGWGSTYTPLTDQETIVVVEKNQITDQILGNKVNSTAIPIPEDGYLVVLRGDATKIAPQLSLGTEVNLTSTTTPREFNHYAEIVGAGPLLLKNRQIVLDAKSEKFSPAFIAEKAIRSSICLKADGTLAIATVQHRVHGPGPTLAEEAKLLLNMGCVNALNLDGGSSTSLYLGGDLLNRLPSTAGRIHNGIGIFLQTK